MRLLALLSLLFLSVGCSKADPSAAPASEPVQAKLAEAPPKAESGKSGLSIEKKKALVARAQAAEAQMAELGPAQRAALARRAEKAMEEMDEKMKEYDAEPTAAKPAALDGTKYGAGVSLPQSISIAELQANVDKYEGKEVRVEGLVTGVCPKRGCWFDMAGEKPGDSMRFKVTDGVIVFPMEASGKYAVAQGTVRKMPMTLEQSKRWAAHQKEEYGADLDPDAITEPLTLVRLDGSGAMIRDAK